ncbi:transposase [Stappia sp. MMSF_3263]|uniref:transposase n=1 Tax=Stappia sp. MMSF_3263 TaxID=3046693 RepID=UPI00273E6899|nr:transposase [Stappia sp. MMSF_3263]
MTVVIGVVFDVSNVSGGNSMRYEVITGVERRRRWPDEEKLTILGEVGVDGETVASVARRHDITRQHIYQWRTEMRRKGLISDRKGLLVPVEVAEDAVSGTSDAHSGSVDLIEVVLTNGRSIRASTRLSDTQWIRLMRIAEAT